MNHSNVSLTSPTEPTRRSVRKKFKTDLEYPGDVNGTSPASSLDEKTTKKPSNLKSDGKNEKVSWAKEDSVPGIQSMAATDADFLEMPAFAVDDLRKFEIEPDPYVVYALTFACFERNKSRMERVLEVIKLEESKTTGRHADKKGSKENGKFVALNNSSTSLTGNQKEEEKLSELLADKLRNLLGYFVPKGYKINPDVIYEMTPEELVDINLPELERACEGEFSRLIEERKKLLRSRYEDQVVQLKAAVVKYAKQKEPNLKLDDDAALSDILAALESKT